MRALTALAAKQEKKIIELQQELKQEQILHKQAKEDCKHFEKAYLALFVDAQNPATRTRAGLKDPSIIGRQNAEMLLSLDDEFMTEINKLLEGE